MLVNTKRRSDAGSLIHQRGQRLCALVTKLERTRGEPGLQTALRPEGNYIKDQQSLRESVFECSVL